MIKNIFLLLIIIGLVSAVVVSPDHIGVRNSGDNRLPQMNTEFSVDCPSKAITVNVFGDDKNPIQNANLHLFYTNYGYSQIASGTTNQNGVGQLSVVGNPNYLTALFVLRVENPAYQSQEIEFNYDKCSGTVSQEEIQNPPQPPPIVQNNTNNGSKNNTIQPTPQNNNTVPSRNQTENRTNQSTNSSVVRQPTNTTNTSQNPLPSIPGCKLPIAIFGFVLFGAVIIRSKQ